MTGFGDSRGQDDRLCVAVEVRSVNNRYFKIVVKSPERFQPLEGEIERVVRESISRGTVNVSCVWMGSEDPLLIGSIRRS